MGDPGTAVESPVASIGSARLELKGLRLRDPRPPGSRADRNAARPPGIDLILGAGETVVVLGSRQDELTALLRTIVGVQRAAAGSIRIDGVKAFQGTTGVQFVSRDSILPLAATVGRTLETRARLFGLGSDAASTASSGLCQRIGLGTRSARSIRDLTQSEQHRLRLALGLIAEPRLLCLDLPGSAFDVEGDQSLQSIGSDLQQRGGSILWVSTSFGERERATDRCARLQDGRILWVRDSASIATARPTFEIRLEGTVDPVLQRRTTETFECITGSSFEGGRLVVRFVSEDDVDRFVAFCAEHRMRLRGLRRQRASLDQLVPPIPPVTPPPVPPSEA